MTKLQIIFDAVSSKTGLEIDKKSRVKKYVMARALYYQLARKYTTAPLTEIGAFIGKDHASVIHSLKYFERDIINDKNYFETYNSLSKYLEVKMPEDKEEVINKDILVHYLINLKNEVKELRIKANSTPIIEKLVVEPDKDPFIEEIRNLDEEQRKVFKERASIMLKFVKTIRTYENTHKREFNAA